jgi:peptidoglycan/LPS O-acetylase OafA/YrhL
MNLIQKDKVAQLHILRAIAAFGVVLTHAKFMLWSGGVAYLAKFPVHTWSLVDYPLFFSDLISSLGTQRVYMFFILSGFFIKFSVRGSFSLPGYLRKRLLRIYPAFLVTTLLAGAVLYVSVTYINTNIYTDSLREYNSLVVNSYQGLTFLSLLSTLSFSKVGEYFGLNPQYWSLKHEIIFYLLFPIYNLFTFRRQVGLLCICLVLAVVTGSPVVFCQLFFLVGMLLYQGFEQGVRLPFSLPAWLYCTAFGGMYLGIYWLSKQNYTYLASLLTVTLAFLALEFLLTRTVRVPRAVAWFSKVSYSVYLNHMWALLLYYAVLSRISGELVFYSRWPYYTGAILAVICSLPVYYLVEKPTLAYLQRTSTSPWVMPRMVSLALVNLQALKLRLALRKAPVEPARHWAALGAEPASRLPPKLVSQTA